MKLTFECMEDGRWYVVMPDYPGPHEDLEMVENADNSLDALTDDCLFVTLDVNLEQPSIGGYFTLDLEAHDEDGAFYNVNGCGRFCGVIWLCNFVHEVFEDHPDKIYVQ